METIPLTLRERNKLIELLIELSFQTCTLKEYAQVSKHIIDNGFIRINQIGDISHDPPRLIMRADLSKNF